MPTNDVMLSTHFCVACKKNNVVVKSIGYGQGIEVRTKCPDCKSIGIIRNFKPFKGIELTESKLKGMFAMAGVEIIGIEKLKNGYWNNLETETHPWWFVKTKYGWVKIGYRKRVLSISWEDTDIRKIATTDDVTKSDTYVHAWSDEKAIEYIRNILGQ